MEKYYINNDNWQKIYDALSGIRGIRVGCETTTRLFFEGAYFIMRTGAQWRDLPSYYGKWRSAHKRYEAWSRRLI